jgi:nucleoside-diphosphate-sugar epimerase
MRILVTGAAGFIGSHLAERLAALGHTVIGLDALTDYYSPALKQRNVQLLGAQGVTVLPLDLAADDLGNAVKDVEIVYHLAAQPGISATTSYDTYVRNNLTATYRLIEAARRSNALRAFVNVATSSVYGSDATGDEATAPQPTSYYGVTKLAAEQLALAYQRDKGFPACSFRLFSVYGPRERPDKLYPTLIRSLLTDQPFPLFEGAEQHLRSYTYVGDIVDGLLLSLTAFERCVGEIFNLGTDTAITTVEGIRIVDELIGKPARIARQPRRAGDQSRTHANIGKARRILGYNPLTTPREGLAQTVAWYREHL